MNVFFDTSVLVAASLTSHPHHVQAHAALRRVATKTDKGFIGAHSLAEIYAILTRLPLEPRIHPLEAVRIIAENILPHFEVIPLLPEDYAAIIAQMGEGGRTGEKIYDALLLSCAAKCPAERIYTFNVVEFRKLAPTLQDRICAP
jgi:predicted nucleic acid-binding protein